MQSGIKKSLNSHVVCWLCIWTGCSESQMPYLDTVVYNMCQVISIAGDSPFEKD